MTRAILTPTSAVNVRGIDGLSLTTNAITAATAADIVAKLQGQLWQRWRRRQPFDRQEFGYEYQIGAGTALPTTPIPDDLRALFPALRAAGWTGADPTQVIVNRYPRGGSINAHTDSPTFGPVIGAFSLGTEWPIYFSRRYGQPGERVDLPVLSAYVMKGPARRQWRHRIPPTFEDERISLTFRTMAADGGR